MAEAILSSSQTHKTRYVRDEHDESGIVHVETTHYDDATLERNKRERLDGTVKSGAKIGLLDDTEEVVYHFRIPNALQWKRFKRKYPNIYFMLVSKDHLERERASAELASIHPEWVVTSPKSHHF